MDHSNASHVRQLDLGSIGSSVNKCAKLFQSSGETNMETNSGTTTYQVVVQLAYACETMETCLTSPGGLQKWEAPRRASKRSYCWSWFIKTELPFPRESQGVKTGKEHILYRGTSLCKAIRGQRTNHTVSLWASPDCFHGGGSAPPRTQLKALLEQKPLLLWPWCCPQHQAHKPPSITTPWHTDDKCGLTNIFSAKNVMCGPFIMPCIIKHCF